MRTGRFWIGGPVWVTPGRQRSPWDGERPGCAERGKAELLVWSASDLRARVRLPCPAILVHTSNRMPGWRSWVGGEPAELFDALGTFQAVWVPEGEHEVRFAYRPASLLWGGAISVLALLAAAAVWLAPRRRTA